jgi:periplasmic divalent cation tolerance protein
MSEEDDFVVVFCTASPGEADFLARTLVEERLAACVNIASVRSCYIWDGKLSH